MIDEEFLSDLKKEVASEKIVKLIKQNEINFLCELCGRVPLELFKSIGNDCAHNFCESCINKMPFFLKCPRCHKVISKKLIAKEPAHNLFLACYQNYKKELLRYTVSESKGVRGYKKSEDISLQAECQKLFKNPNGSKENIKKLLSSGANPNVLYKDGLTLMHEAVDYENLQILEMLLEAGGNVNAYGSENCSTCLHKALNKADISSDIIKCLLEYGADIHARDRNGETALSKAAGDPVRLELLQKHKKIYEVPLRPIPTKVPILYACNLSLNSLKSLSSFCQTHKIKFAGKNMSKDVTHVIVEEDPCEPHPEVLMGILLGCYIVKYDWIVQSLKKGCVIPADNFEITGTKNYPESKAPLRSRLNAESLKPRLFASGQFFIMDGIEQKLTPLLKEKLAQLIIAGGGKILKRSKSFDELEEKSVFYHADLQGPLALCSVIVLYNVKPPIIYKMDTVRSFPVDWLLNAIQTFTIEEYETET